MDSIYHFYFISERLACSGQPTEAQIKELVALKYTCIINLGLLNQKYSLPDEARLVESLGMKYVHIPVSFEKPAMDDLKIFLKVMRVHENGKVLVHCAANYRASCFTQLYLFYTNAIAEADMEDAVYEVWQPDAVWQGFLEEGIHHIKQLKDTGSL